MKAIDLFAGLGGFTEGAEQAGCRVLWAANHWRAAVETHHRNHPRTAHVCQDLQQADPGLAPAHDILLASPCCQGHTNARGKRAGNPQHDASRATAWAVVTFLEYHRPQAGLVENVPKFMKWPLFPAWRMAIEALGYSIEPMLVDAADCGVPQHRERLFLVLARSRSPLRLRLRVRRHVPAKSIIDFGAGEWSPVDQPGRAPATLRRVENGRRDFGARFVMPYYGSGSGLTGRSIDRPIGTVTTVDRWAVVDGDRMRMLSIEESRASFGLRKDYALPAAHKDAMQMLGNMVAPACARDLISALRAQI
jgi:DNA (cytosine-5)-methyltransferase 1